MGWCHLMILLATAAGAAADRADWGAEVLVLTPTEAAIAWGAPQDGGTPRDPSRVEVLRPSEFRIRTRAEEGRSPLTHAVSRADLVCHNGGTRPQEVTLHLDLSGDGSRENADRSHFGGMPRRDFIFIQPPGQDWRQVDGKTAGWVCTVRFTAPPGDTKVGLSPWYTYGDYLRFVRSLPEHPHFKKDRVATSDGGREHWELTVTDAAVPAAAKKRIFWHAREHAYETFSSFAMEGLLAYLLSEEAAGARRRFVFTIHPMSNVDGVADGCEYRGRYDYPNVRGTASARLVFDTLDRLRPDYIVTWHNWIAPRDVDCLFYTDAQDGRPARRAWDLFTQRFPSPRTVGHRWDEEGRPERKNWLGRQLSEDNTHQYAMKRYGSAVWGWEMPWWRRTVADARRAGAEFAKTFLETVPFLDPKSKPAAPEAPALDVPRWELHEFVLHGRSRQGNPFRNAALVGEFTAPSGKVQTVEGFYGGGDTWRLRFAPDEEGQWRYLLRGEGVELSQRGRLRCTAPRGHGFIRIHPENPYAFAFSDGTPFFPMGDTCYGLYNDSPITPQLRTEYLEARRRQRFNFVRMGVQHSPKHWETDNRFWPWGGTPRSPDLDRFNPAFFQGLDSVLRQMNERGINAELIVLNYYSPPMNDPRVWTPSREQAWVRYVMARYAAFPNLFLWTVCNEHEVHPNGQYRLDVPGDPDWAKATARFIKAHDPYRHPVTVRPVISASARGTTTHDAIDPPWRIGELFGADDALDVLSQQTGQAGQWDEAQQCWTGDDPDLVASLRADLRFGKPVLNTENGYEYLRNYPTYRRQVHHTDDVRRSAWQIVCAGGYLAAGFSGTLGQSDYWNRMDRPNRYTFLVQDQGAAGQLGTLYDFFTGLPFWRLRPFPGVKGAAVALAEPGKRYVVYLPHGGAVKVDLSAATGSLTVRWFNPRTASFSPPSVARDGAPLEFRAPDDNDWVLILVKDEE